MTEQEYTELQADNPHATTPEEMAEQRKEDQRLQELQYLHDRIAHLETPQGAAEVLLDAHLNANKKPRHIRNLTERFCSSLGRNTLRAIAG